MRTRKCGGRAVDVNSTSLTENHHSPIPIWAKKVSVPGTFVVAGPVPKGPGTEKKLPWPPRKPNF
jgi:hypothetical protein